MSRVVDDLWKEIEDIYEAIIKHPFIEGLITGELNMNIFKEYIIQDALYLSKFARAVALVGVKADSDDDSLLLIRNAEAALSFERASLHEFLMSEWGLKPEDVYRRELSPVNLAYTNYLLLVAYTSPFHEGLSAVLPCFWVYLEVGKQLVEKGSPNRVYQRWIDTYASEEYERAVMEIVELMEKTAKELNTKEIEQVKRHFRLSTIYEYLFWDSHYKMESWPFKF